MSELNAERSGFASFVGENRNGLVADTNGMKAEMAAGIAENRQSMEDNLNEALQHLEDNNAGDESAVLQAFVEDLAQLDFSPNGYGGRHGNGYQPYAKWVNNRIESNTAAFGEGAADTFDAIAAGAIADLHAALGNEKAWLSSANGTAQNKLNGITSDLVAGLIHTRESIEMALTDFQNAQEAGDEAQRDIDQIALVTVKNNLWKDLSWIVRKTFAGYGYGQQGSGHEHGYSAGPVYGYLSNGYAQVTPVSHPEPGYETNYGVDDGYDPFGYGDFGYGYGYAQFQYKEIQDKLNAMSAA